MTTCPSESLKVYEFQICSDEVYAFELLLCDTIYSNRCRIAEIRKNISHSSNQDSTVQMLSEIQSIEGHQSILKDLLNQLNEQAL